MVPQQPGQPPRPDKRQMIPQPGGLPIQVKPAPLGTTPGIVTGPDHKPSQVLLPPGGGSTPGKAPQQLDSRLDQECNATNNLDLTRNGTTAPGQTLGPGQTTQMIPQPGGLPIQVSPHHWNTPGMSQDQITNHLKYFFTRWRDRLVPPGPGGASTG
ncbi:hypothetical protein AVEN_40618-1 [Araneus ventricosus]|uniref:Uncharacterized protein n=1 Tax=Araneus ventricosus TaxID=182803 RepID=A0A4Y2JCS5_ARAVE|nr:hypothetical protein AVEN_40618-1 [Araneus ventricosus]